MYRGQQLISRNRRYRAVFQADGNFVVYADETVALWASDTVDRGFRVTMQRDGNLIVMDDKNNPLWTSKTQSYGDFLMCRDDGSLVVSVWNGQIAWSSNTTQSLMILFLLFYVYSVRIKLKNVYLLIQK